MLLSRVGPSDHCQILHISHSLPLHLRHWTFWLASLLSCSDSPTLFSFSQTFNRLRVSASPTTSCFFQGNNNLSHSVFPSAPFLVLPMSHTLDVCSSLQPACMDFQSIRLAAYSMIFPYLARHLPLFAHCSAHSTYHNSMTHNDHTFCKYMISLAYVTSIDPSTTIGLRIHKFEGVRMQHQCFLSYLQASRFTQLFVWHFYHRWCCVWHATSRFHCQHHHCRCEVCLRYFTKSLRATVFMQTVYSTVVRGYS